MGVYEWSQIKVHKSFIAILSIKWCLKRPGAPGHGIQTINRTPNSVLVTGKGVGISGYWGSREWWVLLGGGD